jgi:CRISPR system Cascade subunit CasA
VEVSAREALVGAHEIAGLALDNPMETVALFRQVLLPVYLAACGLPTSRDEWVARLAGGRVDGARIGGYLDEHANRFDLFSPDRPFAQVTDLRTAKGETKPVSLLIAAAATGNNVPLFAARTEADPPALSPAEAARALLATQCWDTAAIKSGAVGDPRAAKAGKTTGNPTGPLGQLGVTVPLGSTLFETLLLNTPMHRAGGTPGDTPQWRQDHHATWAIRPATGVLDLLTWQARRVRLFPETGGDGRTVVRRVVVAAGDRLAPLPHDVEIHTAWRQVSKPRAEEPPVRPIRHQPGRAAWRGLEPLLAVQEPTAGGESSTRLLQQLSDLQARHPSLERVTLQVLTVGVQYGNQSAVVEDVMSDLIPLPVLALGADSDVRNLLNDVVREAEKLRQAANRLEGDLRVAAGGEPAPWDKGQHLGELLVHELTPVVRRLLGGLQREPGRVDEARAAWQQAAYEVALAVVEPLLAALPPEAFLGRLPAGRKYPVRASTAESAYRAAVRAVLGRPPRGGHYHEGSTDAA